MFVVEGAHSNRWMRGWRQRLRAAVAATIALGVAACAHVQAEPPGVAATPVAFTGVDARDSLTIALLNSDRDDGVAVLIVRNAQGAPVYADAVRLSALAWENPVDAWTPELARARLGLAAMPLAGFEADLVARADAGVGAFWPVAQSDALDRARDADRPLLCYVSAPGGYTCAWYDKRSGRGVVLIEGAS